MKIEYIAKKISGLKGPEIFVLSAELRRIMKKEDMRKNDKRYINNIFYND